MSTFGKIMKHLIIDGYNVIFQAEPYASLAKAGEWDSARDALISDIASFVKPEFQVTVVFDGTHNPQPERDPEDILGVTVLFSSYGKTADSVIERLAKQSGADAVSCEIVSSDAAVQWTSLGAGVIRRSAVEFAESLHFAYREYERDRDVPSSHSTIIERISPEARVLLKKIRDGQ
ncbi:MAG: NYN domain-containing protein [Actinomycetes bacterium]|jgi:predicted RNA-binding protein with PIN domain|nr:NYN domain-containing protein [Actinomycetes bacterium]